MFHNDSQKTFPLVFSDCQELGQFEVVDITLRGMRSLLQCSDLTSKRDTAPACYFKWLTTEHVLENCYICFGLLCKSQKVTA